MSQPEWLTLRLRLPASQVERAEALLFEQGAAAVTLLDAEDHPVHEPLPGETPLWPEVVVEGLFEADRAPGPVIAALQAAGLADSAAAVEQDGLPARDWTRAWMDLYRPMRFGQGLWICPSHIDPDPAWPCVIRLDPGLAFGSGTHPTTALCLEWIDGADVNDRQILDYGAGSGILAIACALKGASRATAVDHDPQALVASVDNAERNGVAERVAACLPADFEAARYDIVLANILAGPLIELAGTLADCVGRGGHLVLSGILDTQAEAVAAAYRGRLDFVEQRQREDWVRLVFRRADR